ncbi:hypothetical protein LU631_00915 [Erwinia tracheiphila]|uniref:Surface presentation of antigens, secretory protein invB n=1 Tax=Erwinia tracheiphila TaxID=65700 RepID=A0A0M2KI92_9GAMM|nr:type III secretion system protein [Erwinia tracheiphila]AXF77642.1 hypothetical protein AV903_18880 [Erwinia tracheiphila]EOS94419.1 type III secretion system protein [Erwinia tracheiphila PSU-1]KKF36736.1 surface presentation of antigens, secretory protein invB [Erwinia tracheiphila]UIA83671.1 hypothetical protein LU604_00470 [Erwinia tracheiphila]UIA88071.1 hypothetical protein LU631_00915 [Erwinia tracheiphila]
MKQDIVTLLREMLNDAGLDDIIDSDLSNHSTISLNMKDDIPTINIKTEGDEVWVWARVGEYTPSTLAYCSEGVFSVMFNFNEDFFHLGQPCLYPVDGHLELRALVKESFLESSDLFGEVLEHFLNVLQEYCVVLK